jgi:hypothetical protein
MWATPTGAISEKYCLLEYSAILLISLVYFGSGGTPLGLNYQRSALMLNRGVMPFFCRRILGKGFNSL